jgi:tRNA threonylcarbamoyladenosine biosynthesis protein TsaE
VKSPTYSLVEEYQGASMRIYHLDLYRLSDKEELEFLGLRDILADDALVLIEWPEKGAGWLPVPDREIRLSHQLRGRKLDLFAHSRSGKTAVNQIASIYS